MKRITINSEDRNLNRSSIVVGYLEENRAEKIKFDIPEEYKDFSKKACFKAQDKTFVKIFDDVVGDTLTFTSDITKYSDLDMTIVFFKQDNEDEIIAKTSKLHIKIKDAIICDDDVQPDEPKVILLDQLIETVTNKINEVNNLNIKGERVEDGVNVIFTDKQGNESVQKVNDGESGKGIPQGGNKGQVLIKKSENDYDTEWGSTTGISIASRENLGVIKVGENLNISEDGTLNAEKSTQSYTELTNKPQINGITLEGNKTTSDLGINGIVELKGTEENPIELANIGEVGIYKILGYRKNLLTSVESLYGDIILEVAKSGNEISQHYWESNSAFYIKARVTFSGIPFTENFHAFSQDGDIENYSSINAFSLINSLTLSRYLGRGYMGKVSLTDLKTTDKNSLVNAINELVNTKQDKLTAGSGVTIEDNVISALGGGEAYKYIHEIDPAEGEIFDLATLMDDGIYYCHSQCSVADERYKNKLSDAKGYGDFIIIISHGSQTKIDGEGTTKNKTVGRMDIVADSYLNFTIYQGYNVYIASSGKYKKNLHNTIRLNPQSDFTLSSFPPNMGAIQNLAGYIANNYNNIPTLNTLTTIDKTSLVNAINEVNGKITSGTFATNLAEVQGYDATKTQVLKNVNGVLTWVEE